MRLLHLLIALLIGWSLGALTEPETWRPATSPPSPADFAPTWTILVIDKDGTAWQETEQAYKALSYKAGYWRKIIPPK